MSEYRELNNLPKELQMWGERAVSRIKSPEKRHEAANDLRQKMDGLWGECPSKKQEEKTAYVLSRLGDAQTVAEELKNTYIWKGNPKLDRKIGIGLLILSVLSAIYPYWIFFVVPEFPEGVGWMAMRRTREAAGAGAAFALGVFIVGVAILRNSRKTGTQPVHEMESLESSEEKAEHVVLPGRSAEVSAEEREESDAWNKLTRRGKIMGGILLVLAALLALIVQCI